MLKVPREDLTMLKVPREDLTMLKVPSRPAAMTNRQERQLEVDEMRKLRFSLGVAMKDKIRDDHIRVDRFGKKVRPSNLIRYGYVKSCDDLGRRVLEIKVFFV